MQAPIATPSVNVGQFRKARAHASTLRPGFERGRRRNGGAGVYFARTGPVDLGPRVWFQRHVGFIATRDLSCPVGKRRRGHPESRQAVSSSSENNLQVKVIFQCHFMVVQSNSFTNSHIPENIALLHSIVADNETRKRCASLLAYDACVSNASMTSNVVGSSSIAT